MYSPASGSRGQRAAVEDNVHVSDFDSDEFDQETELEQPLCPVHDCTCGKFGVLARPKTPAPGKYAAISRPTTPVRYRSPASGALQSRTGGNQPVAEKRNELVNAT